MEYKELSSILVAVLISTFGIVPLGQTAEASLPTIDYVMIFISDTASCTKKQVDRLHLYDELTSKYLLENNLRISKAGINCISIDDYLNKRTLLANDKLYDKFDLVVFVLDQELSYRMSELENIAGRYSWHDGTNERYIIAGTFNTLYDDVIYKRASWILSHELMHFLIEYKNYGDKYHDDYVHRAEFAFRYCVDEGDLSKCKGLWVPIKLDNGWTITMMKPMHEPYKATVYELNNGILPKQSTYLYATVNNQNLVFATNGETILCTKIYMKTYENNLVKNVKLQKYDMVTKATNDKEVFSTSEIIHIGNNGIFHKCKTLMLGVMDDVIVRSTVSFAGNNLFLPSTSERSIIYVKTPW